MKDDDLYLRAMKIFNKTINLTPEIGNYFMTGHEEDSKNADR